VGQWQDKPRIKKKTLLEDRIKLLNTLLIVYHAFKNNLTTVLKCHIMQSLIEEKLESS
jgi:predicted RNA-binding protein with PIN domain